MFVVDFHLFLKIRYVINYPLTFTGSKVLPPGVWYLRVPGMLARTLFVVVVSWKVMGLFAFFLLRHVTSSSIVSQFPVNFFCRPHRLWRVSVPLFLLIFLVGFLWRLLHCHTCIFLSYRSVEDLRFFNHLEHSLSNETVMPPHYWGLWFFVFLSTCMVCI